MEGSSTLKWIKEQLKGMDTDSVLEVTKVLSDNLTLPKDFTIKHSTKTVFPILNISECKINGLDSLIDELQSISDLIYLPIKHFGEIKLNFKITDNPGSKYFKDIQPSDRFLIVNSKIDINITETAKILDMEDSSNSKDIKTEYFVLPYYKLLYKTYLTHFIYMTQIAYPGSLWLGEAMIFSKNKKIDRIGPISSIFCENGYYKRNWPELTSIKIEAIWNYVINNTQILNKFSATSIERAFNSFSYLFSDNYHKDIPVSLFWAISGLESLFVSGEVGITQQLNEKIQVFLGDIKENKKLLKSLYKFRSSLIHGTLSIPLNNGILDDQKYQDDLYEMNSFAALVLVASLQKIVKQDMKELNFRYTYK